MNEKSTEAQNRLQRAVRVRIPPACLIAINLCDPTETLGLEALDLRNRDLEHLARQIRIQPRNWDSEGIV